MLITHENDVAAQADRVLTIRDGEISERSEAGAVSMNWFETLRTAADAVRAHRLRSLLTMLGIVIGISSVVLTVGLGLGAQDKVRDQIDALGSNLLIVSPGSSTGSGGVRGGFGSSSTLTLADAEAIADKSVAPDVARVAPTTSTQSSLTAAPPTGPAGSSGRPRPGSRSGRGPWPRAGSSPRPSWSPEPTWSSWLRHLQRALQPGQPGRPDGHRRRHRPDGDRRPGRVRCDHGELGRGRPRGGADHHGPAPGRSQRHSVSTVYVEATSADTLSAAYQEVNAALLTTHDVTSAEADFSIATQDALLETANSTNRTMTILLAGIAAISLLVGGIGVMNIMLVSVTERIREIGLRKALGATPSAIRRQFLIEASLLGVFGGVIGATIGVIGAVFLPSVIEQPVSISTPAIAAALVVALGLGVGFGVYPASRAARLTPIDALRSS